MTDPTNPESQDTSTKPTGLVESQVEGQRRLQMTDPPNITPQADSGTGPPNQDAVPPEPAPQGPPTLNTILQADVVPGPSQQTTAASSSMPQTTAIVTASPAPASAPPPGAAPPVSPVPTTGQAVPPPKKTPNGSYSTALVLTGSIVPVTVVASIFTAAFYFSPLPQLLFNLVTGIPSSWLVIFAGFVVTLFLWLLCTIPFQRMATFDNANALSGNHIKSHLNALKASFKVLQQNHVSSGTSSANGPVQNDGSCHYDIAFEKVSACLTAIDEELVREDLCWVTGAGYLNAWVLIHRAEEAMIDIAPRTEVIREAIHDELCIEGSAIDSRDNTLTKLRAAILKLSPSATLYLDTPPEQSGNKNSGDKSSNSNGGVIDAKTEMEARDALHTVKQTLNEFRDGLWEGLVRIRNQLAGMTLYTGLFTYVLLCIAITASATISSIKSATIFYVVGATVGLFGRLYTESRTDRAIGDYGLTLARIVVTPVLAGLAAIAGVFIVAMLSFTLLRAPIQSNPTTTSTATPSTTPIATSVPTTISTSTTPATPTVTSVPAATSTGIQQTVNQNTALPSLADIYDLDRNAQGIMVAAIFGLTPNLLISILQQKAEDFKTQLKNSGAPDQGNT